MQDYRKKFDVLPVDVAKFRSKVSISTKQLFQDNDESAKRSIEAKRR